MKQQGFVLITIILMLTVMTSLVFANMRWVTLYWKRYTDLQRFEERMTQFERMADSLANRFEGHPQVGCFIKYQDDEVLKQSILQNGCKVASYYRYGIHDLGVYPCVKFASTLSSHHWLLSVMDERLPHKLLQLRIATPVPEQPCPKTQIVTIQHSFLTRRLLS